MPARAAISFSAEAISSACARLSSWHGPAISASGNALPKRTFPTLTIGLGADIGPTLRNAKPPVNSAKRETTPGRCGGGNPGPLSFIGLQTRPTARIMANGVLRRLKVVSENPLISINEREKIAALHRPAGSNTRVAPWAPLGPTISLSIRSDAARTERRASDRHVAHRKPHRRKPHARGQHPAARPRSAAGTPPGPSPGSRRAASRW